MPVERSLSKAATALLTIHAPSVVSVGVDVVDLAAFAHNKNVGGERWLRKVFTEAELAAAAGRIDQLATGFAGKEAAAKALKTGFRGVSPRDIEVVRAPSGDPRIRLHGRAKDAARTAGVAAIPVSLSRDGGIAVAVALGLSTEIMTGPENEEVE